MRELFRKYQLIASLALGSAPAAVLIFYITGLALGKNHSIEKLLLSLVGFDSIGNSVWFIFDIIILYLLTFAIFTFAKKRMIIGTAVMTALSFAAVLIIKEFKGTEYWWYDTIMCYPLGMWYALAKPHIDKKILPSFWKWLASLSVTLAVFILLRNAYVASGNNRWYFIAEAVVFALLIVFVSMRISINNKVLQWFGKRVFGVYILQRIPMIVFTHFGLNTKKYAFVAMSFLVTIVLAVFFDAAMAKLDGVIYKKKS